MIVQYALWCRMFQMNSFICALSEEITIVVVGVPLTTIYKTFQGLLECQRRAAFSLNLMFDMFSPNEKQVSPGSF